MSQQKKEKKHSLFQWILFAGVIPITFGILMLLIVLTISGYNVFEEASKLPVVKQFHEEEATETIKEQYEKQIATLQGKLKNEQMKTSDLQNEIEKKNQEISSLKATNERLLTQITELQENQLSEQQQTISLVSIYEKMAPKNAAQILVEMEEVTALQLLANLKPDTLAKVLEKMPADKAANFSNKLAK